MASLDDIGREGAPQVLAHIANVPGGISQEEFRRVSGLGAEGSMQLRERLVRAGLLKVAKTERGAIVRMAIEATPLGRLAGTLLQRLRDALKSYANGVQPKDIVLDDANLPTPFAVLSQPGGTKVLLFLSERGPTSETDVRRGTEMRSEVVRELVRQLLAEGLAETVPDTTGENERVLVLTQLGIDTAGLLIAITRSFRSLSRHRE